MNQQTKKFDASTSLSTNPERSRRVDTITVISFLLALAVDAFVWFQVAFGKSHDEPRMYFLDVGQGDSELAVLPGGVKILTDAGPDKSVLRELEKNPAMNNRYIDIAVISHPQLDHFNGFQYIADKYRIGALIFNGRSNDPGVKEWDALVQKIKDRGIPFITLAGGDAIRYENSRVDFLSPSSDFIRSGELNDTGLVELLKSRGLRVLLTADIGSNIEHYLLGAGQESVSADILKVGHHGSRFSSSDEFLKAVNPKIAIIEVGANNRYGHPTKETLARLASSTSAKVFRTDLNGAVAAIVENGKLKVFTEK
ncbi:MAG: MBL fold metallo-hydrolase [Candidatus Liptonbacteria bacterium]|nr:MBL fold metallo-hydrolase [Candidatus Liptonbacteria bacterium]